MIAYMNKEISGQFSPEQTLKRNKQPIISKICGILGGLLFIESSCTICISK